MNQSTFPSVPRKESLHHRLKTAKDANGKPLLLLDELMVLLEDPPPDVGDRWLAGVAFCAGHGIETSRPSVWRFYHAHVVLWRYENAPKVGQVSEIESTTRADEARHLLTLRAIESLHHPHLPPQVLVGLVHNENRRLELQLARDKFNEQLFLRQRADAELKALAIRNATHAAACSTVWARLGPGASIEEFQHAVDVEKAARPGPLPTTAPKGKP